MLLTDKKLLFAFYDGSKWSLMNKFLKDIAKIGRINTEGVVNLTSSSSCLYVEFIDNTNLSLHMNLYDKLTSNPDLFFKKFLTTLDAVVLGKTDEKIASRRRVSVNNESKPSERVDNEVTDKNKLASLATIPSREGLLTMLAGGMIGIVKDLSICLDLYSKEKE